MSTMARLVSTSFRFSRFAVLPILCLAPAPALGQSVVYGSGSIDDLDPPATQATGAAILEAIQGSDDMEMVADLGENDFLRRLSAPVGRLAIKNDDRVIYCTASLIASDRILTNHHCIDKVSASSAASLQLNYLTAGSKVGVENYRVNMAPIETSATLDYAILSVEGNPGQKWGTVKFSSVDPGPSQSLFIFHHPGGFAKHLSRGRCSSGNPAIVGNDLRHVCDTLGGSSGAPIFDNDTRLVVGLHNRALNLGNANSGIRISALATKSSFIAGLMSSQTPAAPSPVSLGAGEDVVWVGGDSYCSSLLEFIRTPSGALVYEKFKATDPDDYVDNRQINGTQFLNNSIFNQEAVRAGGQCYVANGGNRTVEIICNQYRDSIPDFVKVHDQLLRDVRGCLTGSGWTEFNSSNTSVSPEIPDRKSSYGFTNGRQDLWVHAGPTVAGRRYMAGIKWQALLSRPRN
ncbi:trypsin-like peptidase domain-containing protein [Rhizobium laguerreae]|uniref:trypsin-like serine peptidase n=1 Tax=Rhizobium laguerreae TaxID=1076926 RepID=UPI001C9204EE|nr:serine protease [Rhizobium laguerreae]MBY3476087.1 trypsin-like peptidase domain-containing protein [Rhizobium laguerreae]MBY3521075.1 trypsin-like peptidase domain-containing protein [Rhizobium laguerreae]